MFSKVYLKTKKMTDISQTQAEFKAKSRRNPLYIPRLFIAKSRCVCRNRRYFRRFRYTPGQLLRQKAFRPEQRTCFICAAAGGAPTLFFILYSLFLILYSLFFILYYLSLFFIIYYLGEIVCNNWPPCTGPTALFFSLIPRPQPHSKASRCPAPAASRLPPQRRPAHTQ